MSLREQLYSVKNSMTNKIQFSQASLSSRGQGLQSPRPIGANSQAKVTDGPTSLSSKMTNADTISSMTTGQSKLPMTPQDASRVFANYMTDYEKREIFDYPTIYYFN